eukprot:m.1663991 g.1663991  ORF g.1663991 m.1663991 type:complete len:55 (+) comp137973_c0_seq1:128-292(+)
MMLLQLPAPLVETESKSAFGTNTIVQSLIATGTDKNYWSKSGVLNHGFMVDNGV